MIQATTFICSKIYEYINILDIFYNKIDGKNLKNCKQPPYLFLSQPNSVDFFPLLLLLLLPVPAAPAAVVHHIH